MIQFDRYFLNGLVQPPTRWYWKFRIHWLFGSSEVAGQWEMVSPNLSSRTNLFPDSSHEIVYSKSSILSWLLTCLPIKLGGGSSHLTFFFSGHFPFSFFWKQDPIASWSDEHQTSQEFVDQLNCPWAAVAHFWLVCSYVNWFWEWHSWFCSVNWTYRSVSEIIVCCDRQAKKPMGSSPENQQNLSETKRATMMAWIIGIAALFGALQCLISPCCWRVLHYIAVENYVGSLLVFSRDYQETLPRFHR